MVTISSLIMEMENLSVDDEDMGLFLTQTPNTNSMEATLEEFSESEDVFDMDLTQNATNGTVGRMEYSDISEEENGEKDLPEKDNNPTFE